MRVIDEHRYFPRKAIFPKNRFVHLAQLRSLRSLHRAPVVKFVAVASCPKGTAQPAPRVIVNDASPAGRVTGKTYDADQSCASPSWLVSRRDSL
jgi:hypothetical protein